MEVDSDEKGRCMVACIHAVGMAYSLSGCFWSRSYLRRWHCAIHAVYQGVVMNTKKHKAKLESCPVLED